MKGSITNEFVEFSNKYGAGTATFSSDGNYVIVSDEKNNGI
jgi:hypothetical protein